MQQCTFDPFVLELTLAILSVCLIVGGYLMGYRHGRKDTIPLPVEAPAEMKEAA